MKPYLLRARRGATAVSAWLLAFSALSAAPVFADIRFEEVTEEAGVKHTGPSFGASWGDFDGDGWPDLWVGNHAHKPSLYLNQKDGTFSNVIGRVWSGDPADTHGAAWADFDNDGDQDLIELVGAESGKGTGPNLFFVNENGKFVENAVSLGLNDPYGRGRTPLWVDLNRDGLLDVVLMNEPRPDGKAPSAIFLQMQDGFVNASNTFGFKDPNYSILKRLRDLASKALNVLHLKFRLPGEGIDGSVAFAQFAHLVDNRSLNLLSYAPLRVYAMDAPPFEDITSDFGFPRVRHDLEDVAIADFDGDLQMEIYLALTGKFPIANVVQSSPRELKAALNRSSGIRFQTQGEVTFSLDPPHNIKPEDIFIGMRGYHPKDTTFTLTSKDPKVFRQDSIQDEDEIWVYYKPDQRIWEIQGRRRLTNYVVESTDAIKIIDTIGFQPSKGKVADILLDRRGENFEIHNLGEKAAAPNACNSVVAADFDNDMDMDIYLACTGPVENLANILLENDGSGNFTVVPSAGGAAGSSLGRGDSVVTADFDQDGFVDLFLTNGYGNTPFNKGPHQLFRNRGNGNHWLLIDLQGTVSNRDGIGAILLLEAGDVYQTRIQDGGMHRFSQNYQQIHFGLAENEKVDQLMIRWPSGIVQRLQDIKANQILSVKEPVEYENGPTRINGN